MSRRLGKRKVGAKVSDWLIKEVKDRLFWNKPSFNLSEPIHLDLDFL